MKNKLLLLTLFIIFNFNSWAQKRTLDFKIEHHNCESIYSRLHKWTEIEEQIKFLLNLIKASPTSNDIAQLIKSTHYTRSSIKFFLLIYYFKLKFSCYFYANSKLL